MIFTTAPVPLIGAHRGASGYAPENTIAAFDLAVEQGAELIECDVHATADGQLIVHHDFNLARTTGHAAEIGQLTLEAVQRLDAGSWRGTQWAGERIPTFAQVLERYGTRVFINVEIKVDDHPYPRIEAMLARAIRDRGLQERVIVSSFDRATIERLRSIDPILLCGFLSEDAPDDALEAALELGVTAIHLEASLITGPRLRQAHARGLGLLAWTVDDPVEMVRLVELGVDAVMSNYPDRLCEVVLSRRA